MNKDKLVVTKEGIYGRRKFDIITENPKPLNQNLKFRQQTEYLQSRPESLRLDKLVGQQTMLKKREGLDKGIFECKTCSITFKDSISYTHHLNSVKRKVIRQFE